MVQLLVHNILKMGKSVEEFVKSAFETWRKHSPHFTASVTWAVAVMPKCSEHFWWQKKSPTNRRMADILAPYISQKHIVFSFEALFFGTFQQKLGVSEPRQSKKLPVYFVIRAPCLRQVESTGGTTQNKKRKVKRDNKVEEDEGWQ